MIGKFHLPISAGGALPDPTTYCPANGYVLDPYVPYTPPLDIGTPSSEQIWLLMDNNEQAALAVRCAFTLTGYYFAEVYDAADNLISTSANKSTTTTLFLTLPTTTPSSLYVVKLKLTGAGSFTQFYNTTQTGYAQSWQILQAKFNTPNMGDLSNAFKSCPVIKSVIFETAMDSLTTMASMFTYSGIEYYEFPVSLPALTSVAVMFQYSNIGKIPSMWDCDFPLCNTYQGMLSYTTNIKEIIFPSSMPEYNVGANFCIFTNLESITLPTSWPKITTLSGAFQSNYRLKELIVPECPLSTELANICQYNRSLKKLVFLGAWNSLTSASVNFVGSCTSLEELEYPRQMTSITSIPVLSNNATTGQPRLKTVRLPDLCGASITLTSIAYPALVMQIYGDMANTNTAVTFTASLTNLQYIDCPLMTVGKISIGSAISTTAIIPAMTIKIDWVNSAYGGTSPQIYLRASLDATELNRIMTALPVVVGKTADFRYCDGYATCDKAIATAKGWTML